jgi:hypothetical protein
MSQLRTNAILDSSGGNTATVNGMTPTAQSLQGFRNRIINGAMVIDERNGGAAVTPTNILGATYLLDRWATYGSVASKFSVQQNAGSVTPPAGYPNYLGVTSLSSYSVGAGEFYYLYQAIESFNMSDFAFGSASASSVTLSFWVRSSLTGAFSGSLTNGAFSRSYPFTYTINAANTWEQKTVTVAGDTTGSWTTGNGTGMNVFFNLGSGSNNLDTAGAWTAAGRVGVTSSQSIVATNGATFYITGVQLEAGSVATPFERRDYGTELARCQRYYWSLKSAAANGNYLRYASGQAISTTGTSFVLIPPAKMRVTPAVSSTGSFAVWDGVSVHPTTGTVAIGTDGSSNEVITIGAATATAVLTQFRPYELLSNNNSTSALTFDSEL